VAIKVVDVDRLSRSNQKLKRHLDSEITIMKSVQHDHIVQQLDVLMVPLYLSLPPPPPTSYHRSCSGRTIFGPSST
jgi:serine/threonine protein kinase